MHCTAVKTTHFRNGYNYDRDAVSKATGLACLDPSMAKQEFKAETDINTIVEQFGLTGQMPSNARMPTYGDFSVVTDYQTAMNAVRSADEAFMALPAALREYFSNDPQTLLEFVSDDSNRPEAEKLGLIPTPSLTPSSPEKALAPEGAKA